MLFIKPIVDFSIVQKSTKNSLLLIVSLFLSWQSLASNMEISEEDDWGDDTWVEEVASPWTFSGFTEAGYGYLLQHNIVDSHTSLNEITTRLNLDYSHEFQISEFLLI